MIVKGTRDEKTDRFPVDHCNDGRVMSTVAAYGEEIVPENCPWGTSLEEIDFLSRKDVIVNHYDNYSTRCIADHVPYQWDEAFAYAADPYVIHVVSYDDPAEWGGQKFSEELFFAYETEGNSVVRDDGPRG